MTFIRKALLIGIDDYPRSALYGCTADALNMSSALSFHSENLVPNFSCKLLLAEHGVKPVEISNGEETEHEELDTNLLKEKIFELFETDVDVALLYFAGHGDLKTSGGYLVSQDAKEYHLGVSLDEILKMANWARERDEGRIKEIIIILDCCYSGAIGSRMDARVNTIELKEGISILTATRKKELAQETPKGGVFTSLVCNALNGGATNVMGNVTLASVYEFVNRGIEVWTKQKQRPMIKMHVSKNTPIRQFKPELESSILSFIPLLFPRIESQYRLHPSMVLTNIHGIEDPGGELVTLLKLMKFGLVKFQDHGESINILQAAKDKTSCILTPTGKYHWTLINDLKS